jgi:ribosomal protein L9
LRYFTAEAQLIPTPEEFAQWEGQRAEQEKQRAEQATQRAERLAAKLRELNIDPENL